MRFRHLASAVALTALAASAASAQTTYGIGPGGAIPDNAPGAPFTSVINVTDTGTISSFVDITLVGVTHTFVGDLIARLSHGGVTVDLFNRLGSSTAAGAGDSSNLGGGDYTFADSGSSFLTAALGGATGFTVPGSPPTYARSTHQFAGNANNTLFSAFVGLPVEGDWTLTVSDNFAADTGSVEGWRFQINFTPTTVAAPEPGTIALLGIGALGLAVRLRRRA